MHVTEAAVGAAAVEAFLRRKESGRWSGPKGANVVAAGLAAGDIETVANSRLGKDGLRTLAASTIGGVLVNRIVSGLRTREK